ncbi:four-carbon acid sugar kinase family protein [Rubellimicrobium roseum]|uniref:Four-carbon acid sugar kinase family protein n=1 Tax=Rubellimicrobium roseum TaxID=687525 RepID=A0A5C4NDL7_9RHOB|nr:four-carbon acid sugar kinase family protein [Rubellimicrobium roseum]TNC68262.1 four-carbon acid sugar kinase family protein [Rubellimicrobium roseum]
MSLQLAILADDLTGALDSAAPFAARGCRVEVALRPDVTAEVCALEADVLAVSTRSRELPAAEARAAVAQSAAALPRGVRLFKKIDSRLKGQIEAELSALAFSRALVVPAIVGFGRVVRNGAVTGFGVDDDIPIAPVLGRFAERSLIPDVESDGGMRAALEQAAEADLLVGARGLAEAWARQMTGREAEAAPALAGPRGIFVIGSRDPITLDQVEALRNRGGVLHVPAPNGTFDAEPVLRSDADLVVIQAVPGDRGLRPSEVASNLAEHLRPLAPARCGTLLLTGGATAEAVLGAMGLDRMRLLGECLPGLPVGRAGGLTIVAKSGGFGDVGTLVRVADMIRGAKG